MDERYKEALDLFAAWLQEAQDTPSIVEPTAMSLASVAEGGLPNVRMVLLKGFDPHGFVFYTNLRSDKGQELTANPRAALCFFWAPLERQVRVRGDVEPVSPQASDAYFASRPRGSQIGAWASLQSQDLPDRQILLDRIAHHEDLYRDRPVERPPHWGGLRLVPWSIEFWQGQPSRLHERTLYTRQDPSLAWTRRALYP